MLIVGNSIFSIKKYLTLNINDVILNSKYKHFNILIYFLNNVKLKTQEKKYKINKKYLKLTLNAFSAFSLKILKIPFQMLQFVKKKYHKQ